MDFIGHLANPSHSWVSQTVHSQANIHLKDQSSQQMGLSDSIESCHIIVEFIKIPIQSNIHSWAYHTIQVNVIH